MHFGMYIYFTLNKIINKMIEDKCIAQGTKWYHKQQICYFSKMHICYLQQHNVWPGTLEKKRMLQMFTVTEKYYRAMNGMQLF